LESSRAATATASPRPLEPDRPGTMRRRGSREGSVPRLFPFSPALRRHNSKSGGSRCASNLSLTFNTEPDSCRVCIFEFDTLRPLFGTPAWLEMDRWESQRALDLRQLKFKRFICPFVRQYRAETISRGVVSTVLRVEVPIQARINHSRPRVRPRFYRELTENPTGN